MQKIVNLKTINLAGFSQRGSHILSHLEGFFVLFCKLCFHILLIISSLVSMESAVTCLYC